MIFVLFFRLQKIKKAQVLISGGIDSAVAAYLAVKSFGSENVVFISCPSTCNGNETKTNAQYIADVLNKMQGDGSGVEIDANRTQDIIVNKFFILHDFKFIVLK